MKNFVVNIEDPKIAETYTKLLDNKDFMYTMKTSGDETYFFVTADNQTDLELVDNIVVVEITFPVEDADKENVPMPQPVAKSDGVPVHDAEWVRLAPLEIPNWVWFTSFCLAAIVVILNMFI